ncbi:MAG: histidine kinase [Candidatus Viridilinea halotolerans]|uniref:histidine kinase n=1 Tax=Candidatus Viridilinea halotolerans TaxID=2491704 RepID=A0A426U520_9CHLR|nr:MAG: histidine kinase [Candidatus Viridilinea halotolerans]
MSELEQLHSHIRDLEERLLVAEAHAAKLVAEAEQQRMRSLELGARLSAILSISAALLISRDVDAIVQLVVQEAMDLFPGTNAVQLFLLDHEGDRLSLRAAAANGECRCGHVLAELAVLSPRAMLLTGPQLETALQCRNAAELGLTCAAQEFCPPSNALLGPLRVESTRMGAIVLYGGPQATLYHPRDLPFVQALADLTAVAIDEVLQRVRATTLQRDLALTQSLHAEAQARLNTAQAQLLQSAKLAAVGELSASVAHEINNPLYAARNSLYLVEQDIAADDPQHAFLAIAQQELGRIARIITRMRDFYRPTKAELAATSVNTLLRETLELVQTHLRHGHIHAIANLDPDVPFTVAHADQLRQVFLNIILNACDAMPHGGDLQVTTQLLQTRPDAPATIGIYIADTGIGVPPEHLPHLFEPFYTSKAQGTGLGLAISAHIVTQHSGRITVESEQGQGATFTILLPVNGD